MKRRDFLTALAAAPFLGLPRRLLAAPASRLPAGKTLILLELNGGNDGLNTVIPFTDPAYYRLRPQLAIPRDQVISLDGKVGLHPALEPLATSFRDGDLAVVQGVGYPNPNRSHFRSIEIWETGSSSNQYLDDGWLARVLAQKPAPESAAADALVLARGQGPAAGAKTRTIVLNAGGGRGALRAAARLKQLEAKGGNPALAHILRVQTNTRRAALEIQARMKKVREPDGDWPPGKLGRQLRTVAHLLAAGLDVPVFKLALSGFDTHANQLGTHKALLTQLGKGLAAFRTAMQRMDRWNDVVLMTYAEFGRRVAQNASNGTDHGTAAPHLVMGGRVNGGLYGKQPSLTQLSNGDLVHAVDYRDMYRTVARRFWGVDPQLPGAGPASELGFL